MLEVYLGSQEGAIAALVKAGSVQYYRETTSMTKKVDAFILMILVDDVILNIENPKR